MSLLSFPPLPLPPAAILCDLASDHLKCLSCQAKYDDIKRVVKAAADGPLKGILAYTEDQVRNSWSLGVWLLVLASFLLRGQPCRDPDLGTLVQAVGNCICYNALSVPGCLL